VSRLAFTRGRAGHWDDAEGGPRNDFVIGLVGRELHLLSHPVQAMRKIVQTSKYIETLGPVLVGHALWQSPLAGGTARSAD
jgi:hypothetical protein